MRRLSSAFGLSTSSERRSAIEIEASSRLHGGNGEEPSAAMGFRGSSICIFVFNYVGAPQLEPKNISGPSVKQHLQPSIGWRCNLRIALNSGQARPVFENVFRCAQGDSMERKDRVNGGRGRKEAITSDKQIWDVVSLTVAIRN